MSLKKNTISNYIAQFYSVFLGVFMVPFYIRYLGAEAYGLVGFFALIQSWLLLLDMGMSASLSRETARFKGGAIQLFEYKSFVRTFEVIYYVVGVAIFLLIFFSASYISNSWLNVESIDSNTVVYSVCVMAAAIAVRWPTAIYRSGLIGLEKFIVLNVITVSIVTLKFLGAFILLKYYSADIYFFFKYQLVVSLIEFFVILVAFHSMIPSISRKVPIFTARIFKSSFKFTAGIAYTSAVWVLFTQADKLALSKILLLKDYGYFSLAVLVANGITMLRGPITSILMTRMTILISDKKIDEMLSLYGKVSGFVVSITGAAVIITSLFGLELVYAWTGDWMVAESSYQILRWYSLGNFMLALGASQYCLQFAYGNIKYHVIANTVFVILILPLIIVSAIHYGSVGAGMAWFSFNALAFLIWPAVVHKIFAPGYHLLWLRRNVLPPVVMSLFLGMGFSLVLDLKECSRFVIFGCLVMMGIVAFSANILVSSFVLLRDAKIGAIFRFIRGLSHAK